MGCVCKPAAQPLQFSETVQGTMDGGLIKHKTRFMFLGSGSTPQR
jgi:hypothetical protein